MTDDKAKIAGGVPIVGQKAKQYWVGDREVQLHAAMLELSLTPEQAVQGFGQYAQSLRVRGKGLPATVYFPWIFTSFATEKLRVENEELRKDVSTLQKQVEGLTERLAALEES